MDFQDRLQLRMHLDNLLAILDHGRKIALALNRLLRDVAPNTESEPLLPIADAPAEGTGRPIP
jgi:hypothetical protein